MTLPDPERLKLWVRAGGVCTICKLYLLESPLTAKELTRGELAHNVGQKKSPKSPRGMADLPEHLRDTADNALLLCPNCHTDIDDRRQLDLFDVEKLFALKREHEAFIRHVTSRSESQRTVVLRMRGTVRTAPDDLNRDTATRAVLAGTSRWPSFPFADRLGIEIDLRSVPGEDDASDGYYEAAARRIDETITQTLKPVALENGVPHLSVFAIARLPLLVYLGSRLDDTIATDVYQRHRDGETWCWPAKAERVEFVGHLDAEGAAADTDAVLVVNASGTIHGHELPAELVNLPRFVIEPLNAVPTVDTIGCRDTLASFERAVRHLLSRLEATHKTVGRLHLFAAAPVSAAVTLGRAVGWGIHPSFLVYDRVDGHYRVAMEVNAP